MLERPLFALLLLLSLSGPVSAASATSHKHASPTSPTPASQASASSLEPSPALAALAASPRSVSLAEMAARSPSIRQFLVLGPLVSGGPRDGALRSGFTTDWLGGEATARPEPGSEAAGQRWRSRLSGEDSFDLETLLDPGGSLAYLATQVESEVARDTRLVVGSDGPLLIWLNGDKVLVRKGLRAWKREQDTIPVKLKPGRNWLIMKVARGARWRVSARFAEPDGLPTPGLKLDAGPTPPQLEAFSPLVVAAGARAEASVRTWSAAPLTFRPRDLPPFAQLEPYNDGFKLTLAPTGKDAGIHAAAVEVEQPDAATRLPLPILVTAADALELTPSFDARLQGRYRLEARVRRPDGQFLDLTRQVAWNVVAGQAGQLSRGGLFQPLQPGEVTVEASLNGLSSRLAIRVVAGEPERPFTRRIPVIQTLVSLYNKPGADLFPEQGRLAAMRGRDYVFRNTRAGLVYDLSFTEQPGVIPRLGRSYWLGIQRDLKRRRFSPGSFGLIASLGPAEGPCYGAGLVLGAAAMYCSVPQMRFFVHETQHAFDNVIALRSGFPEMIYGHGYTEPSAFGMPDYPVVAGRHDAWEAAVLRLFDHYQELRAPWNGFLTVVDSDGDGLADNDSRLPTDERRFGSDPTRIDSDGDGLEDLEELTAGIYGGSDPRRTDSDGDGLADGIDPFPLYRTPPGNIIPRAATPPRIDGELEPAWPLLVEGSNRTGQCLNNFDDCLVKVAPRFYATWDAGALYLAVSADRPIRRLTVNLDGSGDDGPWLGGDFYVVWGEGRAGQLLRGDAQMAEDHKGAREVPGGEVALAPGREPQVLELKIPASLGPGFGWDHVFLDRPLASGLTLTEGRRISLSLELTVANGTVTPFEQEVFVPFTLGGQREKEKATGRTERKKRYSLPARATRRHTR